MSRRLLSRRGFGIGCMGATAVSRAAACPESVVSDLKFPPDLMAEIEQLAGAAIREARWLEELPLEAADPGFVFTPR